MLLIELNFEYRIYLLVFHVLHKNIHFVAVLNSFVALKYTSTCINHVYFELSCLYDVTLFHPKQKFKCFKLLYVFTT